MVRERRGCAPRLPPARVNEHVNWQQMPSVCISPHPPKKGKVATSRETIGWEAQSAGNGLVQDRASGLVLTISKQLLP
jgi:hypothetical protein